MPQDPHSSVRPQADRRVAAERSEVAVALECCRETIGPEIARGTGLESLRGLVATYARAARLDHAPPERTLALFKRMVSDLPELQSRRVDERGEITRELSQMVIDSYFEGVVEPRANP